MASVWVVNGDDYREMWGPMFATEQEAKAYAIRDANARRELWALDGADTSDIVPDSVVEVALGSIKQPTTWEQWLYKAKSSETHWLLQEEKGE